MKPLQKKIAGGAAAMPSAVSAALGFAEQFRPWLDLAPLLATLLGFFGTVLLILALWTFQSGRKGEIAEHYEEWMADEGEQLEKERRAKKQAEAMWGKYKKHWQQAVEKVGELEDELKRSEQYAHHFGEKVKEVYIAVHGDAKARPSEFADRMDRTPEDVKELKRRADHFEGKLEKVHKAVYQNALAGPTIEELKDPDKHEGLEDHIKELVKELEVMENEYKGAEMEAAHRREQLKEKRKRVRSLAAQVGALSRWNRNYKARLRGQGC